MTWLQYCRGGYRVPLISPKGGVEYYQPFPRIEYLALLFTQHLDGMVLLAAKGGENYSGFIVDLESWS